MCRLIDRPTVSSRGPMVELRPMVVDDVASLRAWDDDTDVAAALGGRGADWYDWPVELVRDVPWRELLIATEDGRPIGFIQLVDAGEEESHYWGAVAPGTWSLGVWIGSPGDRGRGLGREVMQAALRRIFDHHGAAPYRQRTRGRARSRYRISSSGWILEQ